MVSNVIEKSSESRGGSSQLQRIVTQQVEEIVESARSESKAGVSLEPRWSYQMPSPGVRYYTFQER